MILQALTAIQKRCGYLPEAELRGLAKELRVPLHRIHEVASFYPLFHLQPPPAVRVQVCRDMACHLRDSAGVRAELEVAAREHGGNIAVEGVSCLGQCDQPPGVAINEHVYCGKRTSEIVDLMHTAAEGKPLPRMLKDRSPVKWSIDSYQGKPEYTALKRITARLDADAILREIERADLRGMGGAGFPTARKWAAVRAEKSDTKYVICNADESEPGTFKDLALLRRSPHLMIEGMVIAGLVTGARQGFIYLRHEYHEECAALFDAIEDAHKNQIIGPSVRGSNDAFALEVFLSPGGYIQGEETALLEAMEDRRGEPRNKPPFPVTNGLFGKPTVINNVETLSWIPAILTHGGDWYAQKGVNGAKGLRLVSVSGDVEKPGVYEVPFGITVRELIHQVAGGMRDGRPLQAIATSGPSGGFLPARVKAAHLPEKFVRDKLAAGAAEFDILDLTLDFATVGALGGMLGAAFVVYDDRAKMREQALNALEFFRNESCGKCVPCRLGTQQLTDLVSKLKDRQPDRTELKLINDISTAMQLTSICGLGMVAANPITTALKYFESGS